jgi:hypothetical protein
VPFRKEIGECLVISQTKSIPAKSGPIGFSIAGVTATLGLKLLQFSGDLRVQSVPEQTANESQANTPELRHARRDRFRSRVQPE